MSSSAASIELDGLLLQMRIELSKKGHNCMMQVQRVLHANDDQSSGFLNFAEFEQSLARVGLFLPLPHMTMLNRRFDTRSNHTIDIGAFTDALTGSLSPARRDVVEALFQSLTADGDSVDVVALMQRFRPEHHPKVLAHDKTASAIKSELGDVVSSYSEGGSLSHDRFLEMFASIGASIPLDDDRFSEVVHNTFKLKVSAANMEPPIDPGYLVSVGQVLKEKIRQKTRGQESEALTLTRVFRHFDVDDTGEVTFQEWCRALERFGILMPDKESRALFAEHDASGAGSITYAQFVNDLYHHQHHH